MTIFHHLHSPEFKLSGFDRLFTVSEIKYVVNRYNQSRQQFNSFETNESTTSFLQRKKYLFLYRFLYVPKCCSYTSYIGS